MADKSSLKVAKEIAGHLSYDELLNTIKTLEAKDFLWIESEINLLKSAKVLVREYLKAFANG